MERVGTSQSKGKQTKNILRPYARTTLAPLEAYTVMHKMKSLDSLCDARIKEQRGSFSISDQIEDGWTKRNYRFSS